MKVFSSLKASKIRHKDCILVKRKKGKVTYVLNKTNPRMKARQG